MLPSKQVVAHKATEGAEEEPSWIPAMMSSSFGGMRFGELTGRSVCGSCPKVWTVPRSHGMITQGERWIWCIFRVQTFKNDSNKLIANTNKLILTTIKPWLIILTKPQIYTFKLEGLSITKNPVQIITRTTLISHHETVLIITRNSSTFTTNSNSNYLSRYQL